MTLSFSTKWPKRMGDLSGQPNYFIEKIWLSLLGDGRYCNQIEDYENEHVRKIGGYFEKPQYREEDIYPKRHTIREDKNNRWKDNNDIHFVINNRTKDRFQFAPVIKCVSVQQIQIYHMENSKNIYVDGIWLSDDEIKQLALNDGFPSIKAFFDFFNTDFDGKIIHWTDLKY